MEYIPAKTILSPYREGNDWFSVNYNMNIYRGCCHGCIYCDSRSECYRVEDFDRVRAKQNALEIIERELSAKRRTGVVGTGSMSDPYNPFEREHKLTRGALELIDKYGFGISIATKSALIARDIDLLLSISTHSPVLCKITVTTWDDELCRKVEPGVNPASDRFKAINDLSRAGLFSGILLMPVLPFIEDNEENILGIVHLAAQNGARFIYPAFGMTLRQNQREHYYQKLDETFPGLKEKYIARYGNRYSCTSPNAKSLWKAFSAACDRYGIVYRMGDIVAAARQGYGKRQLSFFGD